MALCARLEDKETLIHNRRVREAAIIFLQEGTRKYTSFQFLKVRAMALSGALSCFEEVWALALAFVFCLQNQNYTQSLGKLYSLGGGCRKGCQSGPSKSGNWTLN